MSTQAIKPGGRMVKFGDIAQNVAVRGHCRKNRSIRDEGTLNQALRKCVPIPELWLPKLSG